MTELFPHLADSLPALDQRIVEAYLASGRTLDDLPFTDDFERIYDRVREKHPAVDRHDLMHRLFNLRKAGRLPRVGSGQSSAPKVPDADEQLLVKFVVDEVGSLGRRDQLPYAPKFESIAMKFRVETGHQFDHHTLWRLISNLAK